MLRDGRCKYRSAFTLVELLISIGVISLLAALLLPAVQSARSAARRSACSNTMRQLVLASQNYESVHGVTLWLRNEAVISLSPFMEAASVAEVVRGGGDLGRASDALRTVGAFLHCPDDTLVHEPGRYVSYPLNDGHGTVVDGRSWGALRPLFPDEPASPLESGVAMNEISDGASNTVQWGEKLNRVLTPSTEADERRIYAHSCNGG